MRAVLVGDVHLADRPPSLRSKDYADQILDKLEWVVDLARREKVDAIIQLGDLFHVKTPGRTSHRLVQRAHDVLTATGIPVVIVAGNHDVVNDRMASLAGQPLGALGRMEGVTLLDGPHPTLPIYALPYLDDWQRLPHELEKYQLWADEQWLKDEWPLLITHAPIFPPGEDPPYEYVSAEDWSDLMQKGTCAYGHIHDPHGVYVPDSNTPVVFSNLGALSRGSLAEATLARKPAVGLYDSTIKVLQDQIVPIEVPHLPVEDVFDMVSHRMNKRETRKMTDFLTGLEEQKFTATSSEDLVEHLKELDLPADVQSAAVELLEWARS